MPTGSQDFKLAKETLAFEMWGHIEIWSPPRAQPDTFPDLLLGHFDPSSGLQEEPTCIFQISHGLGGCAGLSRQTARTHRRTRCEHPMPAGLRAEK